MYGIGISVISPNILSNKEFREAQIGLSNMVITCGKNWKDDPIARDDFRYATNQESKEVLIGETPETIVQLIQALQTHAH